MKMSVTNCSGGKFKLKIMNLQSGASSWENSKWWLFNLGVKVSSLTYLNVQQTPKPEAQLPSTFPLLSLHSVDVRQVPFEKMRLRCAKIDTYTYL